MTSHESVLNALIELDTRIDAPNPAPERTEALIRRGVLCVQNGFARAGLVDLKEAVGRPDKGGSPWVLAQLGEAHRVFARDVLLYDRGSLDAIMTTLEEGIGAFDRAIASLQDKDKAGTLLAWATAHRGATLALQYFVASSGIEPQSRANGDALTAESIFDRANRDFEEAATLYRRARDDDGSHASHLVWTARCHAFLLALRGNQPDDAKRARKLLETVRPPDDADALFQSAMDRSVTMLLSFERTDDASRESVENGFRAVRLDPEESKAAYSIAASLWTLSSGVADKKKNPYARHLDSAVESASAKCRNDISQAKAALFGLALIRHAMSDSAEGLFDAHDILRELGDPASPLDIETIALLKHDPVWKWHEANKTSAYSALKNDYRRCFEPKK